MNKMNWRINLASKRGSALIMIVLMFAMLLVLGTGAGVIAASSSHNSIRETKQEQAYIAARSVALAIKDEITGASDPEVLITNLKNNTALSAGFLDGATYDLDVLDLDPNTTKFTVTATTASAVDTYSFVMNKTTTTVGNPVLTNATAFLRSSKNITGAYNGIIEGDLYIHDSSAVTVKATINGSVFVNSPSNGKSTFDLGTINGSADYDNPSRNIGIVASGPIKNKGAEDTTLTLKTVVNGDVYVRGDIELEGNGRINGDLYISGEIKKGSSSLVSGTTKTNINTDSTTNPDSVRLNHYLEMIDSLYESYDEKQIDLAPDWAQYPDHYDRTITLNKMTSDLHLNIDQSQGSEYYDILLEGSTLNYDIITSGNGKIRFFVNQNLELNTGAIITDNPSPETLNNYLISDKANIKITVKTSLYAYVYVLNQGNNGKASGEVNFQNQDYLNYHKLYGSVFAADVTFNAGGNGKIKYPSSADGSGGGSGGGTTTTTWNYAGVTAP